MAIYQKGAISFGLVYIPVELHTATRDNDISFNQLPKADHARIKYKKVCTKCGEEVTQRDIVRGYQYARDQYVVVTDEEIEKIKTEKDRTISIMSFVAAGEISPLYYDKAYHVVPQKGGGKALELLRLAMLGTKRAALGKAVFGNTEKLLVILPREDGILIETLLFHDDLKELEVSYERPAISEAELQLAEQLIAGMVSPFEPEKYHDEFQQKLRALIADKIAGKAVSAPKEEKTGHILDLMEALKASVKTAHTKKSPPKTAKGSSRSRTPRRA